MKKIKPTNWPKAIEQIQAKGFTQADIERKTGVRQSIISRLKTGVYKDVMHSTGAALMKLLKKGK